jgi:hypothetical protein
MATRDQVQAKIAAFARQLAEEFGEIDEENLDQHAPSWLDAVGFRFSLAKAPRSPRKVLLIETVIVYPLRSLRLCESPLFIIVKNALPVSLTSSKNNRKLFIDCPLIPDFAVLPWIDPGKLQSHTQPKKYR